jgi:anti-anti-sigma regulatory factor
MFKISIVDTPSQRTLVVEGRLSEPWVGELPTTWRNACHDLDGRRLVIDLSSLTVISRKGEDAIFDLMKQGAKFCCAGILNRHVLRRLARSAGASRDRIQEKIAENIRK